MKTTLRVVSQRTELQGTVNPLVNRVNFDLGTHKGRSVPVDLVSLLQTKERHRGHRSGPDPYLIHESLINDRLPK